MKRFAPILFLTTAGLASGDIVPYTVDANTVHLWHFDEALVLPHSSPDRKYPEDAPGVITPWRLDNGYHDNLKRSGIMGGTGYTGFGGAGLLDHAAGGIGNHYEFRKGKTYWGVPPGGTASDIINPTGLLGSTDGPFTFEGLYKWDGGGPDVNRFLFKGSSSDGNGDSDSRLRVVLNNPGNRPTFNISLPNFANSLTPLGAVPNLNSSDWYHMALTFAGNNAGGSEARFYWTKVDPSATEATLVHTFSTNSTTPYDIKAFQIGNWDTNNFQGLVDEFRISNVARAANEMIFGGGSSIFIFRITNIVRNPDTGAVTLTFTSTDEGVYKVEASIDLVNWDELNDNVDGQPGTTDYTDSTYAINPSAREEVFYRVTKNP